MIVSDQQYAILRNYLTQDAEQQASSFQLTDGEVQGFRNLAHAALTVAARRRFSPVYSHADVVNYIAKMRIARSANEIDSDLDPSAAERVLRHALGEPVEYPNDSVATIRATLALLDFLLGDLNLDLSDINALLAEARALTNEWVGHSSW